MSLFVFAKLILPYPFGRFNQDKISSGRREKSHQITPENHPVPKQTAPQELLKQYVQSQHFTSTAEIMAAMKEMFRDVIQQVMEVEMDEELGRRERGQRAVGNVTAPNYRNGYSQKDDQDSAGRN